VLVEFSNEVISGRRLAVAGVIVGLAVGAFFPQADSSISMRENRLLGLDLFFIETVMDIISPVNSTRFYSLH
jgi:hypothetical protein